MYLFEGQVPDVSKLRTFGCKVFAKVPLELRHELDPRCHIGLYLGNERDTNGHRVLVVKHNGKPTVKVVRDIVTMEPLTLPSDVQTCEPKCSQFAMGRTSTKTACLPNLKQSFFCQHPTMYLQQLVVGAEAPLTPLAPKMKGHMGCNQDWKVLYQEWQRGHAGQGSQILRTGNGQSVGELTRGVNAYPPSAHGDWAGPSEPRAAAGCGTAGVLRNRDGSPSIADVNPARAAGHGPAIDTSAAQGTAMGGVDPALAVGGTVVGGPVPAHSGPGTAVGGVDPVMSGEQTIGGGEPALGVVQAGSSGVTEGPPTKRVRFTPVRFSEDTRMFLPPKTGGITVCTLVLGSASIRGK